jgi:hypothetical protein
MAGELSILSKSWEDEEKIILDLCLASHRARINFYLTEQPKMNKIYNHIEEWLLWDIYLQEQYDEYMNKYGQFEPEENNHYIKIIAQDEKLFKIAMTDNAHDDHIIYDFAIEYLKLNPDKYLYEEAGGVLISLKDITRIASQGGYYKEWCYRPL